ncbi:hypothetical protein [Asticcacaulis solisilvae]|uniref:hypothetical protein n=1 Tax=Asticcacaulis solisilvae TaxID=1217274 RepID=UPI003FD8258E
MHILSILADHGLLVALEFIVGTLVAAVTFAIRRSSGFRTWAGQAVTAAVTQWFANIASGGHLPFPIQPDVSAISFPAVVAAGVIGFFVGLLVQMLIGRPLLARKPGRTVEDD